MLQNIFDTHAHYDASRFDKDRAQLLGALPEQGVRAVVSAGDTLVSSQRGADLADAYSYIYFSAGIHPHNAKEATDDLEERLAAFAQHPKLVAIGEIGLDYYYDHSPREVQKEVFARQLEVAEKLDLPVIIHCREATQDTLEILQKYQPRGVVHSYSGSLETSRILLDMGMYLGFTGAVTFKNARRPVEVAEEMPLERMLLETDAPYMAPEPVRGRRSDSTMIAHIARRVGEIRGEDPQHILNVTFENACKMYGISPEDI